MIRGIGGSIVRVTSYAFPVDETFPQIVQSLEPPFGQKPPEHDMEEDDLLTLRFNLQTRCVSLHTVHGALAWDTTYPHSVQVRYRREGDNQTVFLGLAETETGTVHPVLQTNAYTLLLLARYRQLADTVSNWTGSYTQVVEEK